MSFAASLMHVSDVSCASGSGIRDTDMKPQSDFPGSGPGGGQRCSTLDYVMAHVLGADALHLDHRTRIVTDDPKLQQTPLPSRSCGGR